MTRYIPAHGSNYPNKNRLRSCNYHGNQFVGIRDLRNTSRWNFVYFFASPALREYSDELAHRSQIPLSIRFFFFFFFFFFIRRWTEKLWEAKFANWRNERRFNRVSIAGCSIACFDYQPNKHTYRRSGNLYVRLDILIPLTKNPRGDEAFDRIGGSRGEDRFSQTPWYED